MDVSALEALAESLASTVTGFRTENNRMLEEIRRLENPGPTGEGALAGGDCGVAADATLAAETAKSSLQEARLNPRERLCVRIKEVGEECARLRESNIRLKQESKAQEQRIKELKHKLTLQERSAHKVRSQDLMVSNLKLMVEKKAQELQQLQTGLDEVKKQLNKEQEHKPAAVVKKHQKCSKNASNVEMRTKMAEARTLLLQVDGIVDRMSRVDPHQLQLADGGQLRTVVDLMKSISAKMVKMRGFPNSPTELEAKSALTDLPDASESEKAQAITFKNLDGDGN